MERRNLVKGAFHFVIKGCSREYKGDGKTACRVGAATTVEMLRNRIQSKKGLNEAAKDAARRCENAYLDTPGRSPYKYPGQLQTICIQSVNDVIRIVRRGRGLGRAK